jgi:hypothetical protein
MMALIEDSEQYGLPFDAEGDDYSAPSGSRVKQSEFGRRPKPWLGELRVEERTPKKPSAIGNATYYRLYFGEPDEPPNAILGLSIGEKLGRDREANRKQTKQMRDAMWALIHWCERQSPATGWRKMEETG